MVLIETCGIDVAIVYLMIKKVPFSQILYIFRTNNPIFSILLLTDDISSAYAGSTGTHIWRKWVLPYNFRYLQMKKLILMSKLLMISVIKKLIRQTECAAGECDNRFDDVKLGYYWANRCYLCFSLSTVSWQDMINFI